MRGGMSLDDVPSRISWDMLGDFIRYAGPDSAIYAAAHPEHVGWTRTAYILADIYDAIRSLEYTVAAALGGKPKKPKPYERPGMHQTIKVGGKGTGMPIAEFDKWWEG